MSYVSPEKKVCDENKELENNEYPLIIFLVEGRSFKRQPTKSTQTEASNSKHRDSTLNKGSNSQLTSEYL